MESLEHRSKAQALQRRYHVLYWFMLGLIELGNLHAILYTYFFSCGLYFSGREGPGKCFRLYPESGNLRNQTGDQ